MYKVTNKIIWNALHLLEVCSFFFKLVSVFLGYIHAKSNCRDEDNYTEITLYEKEETLIFTDIFLHWLKIYRV